MHNFSYIYVATNESIPNIVKIGFTRRNPSERMVELDTTGVPTPFDIAFVACLEDAKNLEQLVHRALNYSRVRNDREFFTISPNEAAQKILSTAATHKIEIFFHKFDSSVAIPVGEAVYNDESFELYEREFFDALITLDSKLIYKKWEMYSGYYVADKNLFGFQTEIESKYKLNFDLYLKKIALLGNDDLDSLFLNELPALLKSLDDPQCYELFYFAYSLLRIKKTAQKIALDYFRRAKNLDDFIDAAGLLFQAGLEDEAYNLYCENLLQYYEKKHDNSIPLFIFTAIALDKYSRTKSLPADFYYKSIDIFYSNAAIFNDNIKKEEWIRDREKFFIEIYKLKSPDPWIRNFFEISELTKKVVIEINSVDSYTYKELLTDYLRNIFFYTSNKE